MTDAEQNHSRTPATRGEWRREAVSRGVARGAAVTLLGQWLKLIVQLLSVVVLARLLAPEDFGLFAMVAAITGFATVIGDFGLSASAIQAKTLSRRQSSNLFWINTGVGVAAAGFLLLASGTIASFYGQDAARAVLAALAANFILTSATTQFSASLTRRMKFGPLFVADVSSAVAGLAAAVVMAILGAGVWALVAQKLVMSFTALIVIVVASGWLPGLPARAPMRALIGFGWRTFAVQVLIYASTAAPMVVLGRTAPPQVVGHYERAQQVSQLPASQLATPLTRVMMPLLSRHQDDPAALTAYLVKAQFLLAYAVGGILAIMAGFSDLVVRIALGPGWEASAGIITLLCVGGYFQATAYVLQWAFVSTGKVGLQLRYSLVNRASMIVLVVLGSAWGAHGVAAAVSVGLLMNWLVLFLGPLRRTGVRVQSLAAAAVRPLSVHVAAVGAGAVTMAVLGGAGEPLKWAAGLAVMTLMYGGVTLVIPAVRADVRAALSILRRRS